MRTLMTMLALNLVACGEDGAQPTTKKTSADSGMVPLNVAFEAGGYELVGAALVGFKAQLLGGQECWGDQKSPHASGASGLLVRRGAKGCAISFQELRFREGSEIVTTNATGLSTADVTTKRLFATADRATGVLVGVKNSFDTQTGGEIVLFGQESHVEGNAAFVLKSCPLPWGGELRHAEAVTAFNVANVPHGSTCLSETRRCSDGSLSGTHVHKACTVDPPPPPTVALSWTNYTTSGARVTAGSYIALTMTTNQPLSNCSVTAPTDTTTGLASTSLQYVRVYYPTTITATCSNGIQSAIATASVDAYPTYEYYLCGYGANYVNNVLSGTTRNNCSPPEGFYLKTGEMTVFGGHGYTFLYEKEHRDDFAPTSYTITTAFGSSPNAACVAPAGGWGFVSGHCNKAIGGTCSEVTCMWYLPNRRGLHPGEMFTVSQVGVAEGCPSVVNCKFDPPTGYTVFAGKSDYNTTCTNSARSNICLWRNGLQ